MAASSCPGVMPLAMACPSCPMMSLALGHISCAPKIAPVSAWAVTFMKHRPGSAITVRALPPMTHLPVLTGMPRSLASASVSPTAAISGRQ